ncbi:MAG: glycyl-radical enzyme activating protein [Lachnospiraceae bacterium]|nr:glycyl-radical enzyme activating protein [Lachnospiraceae bacterium]
MSREYLQVKGRIFDIQKFSVHDGPGIRTIVFFKGCVLRCRWCCNPESQRYEIETMMVDGKPKTIGRDVTVEEVLLEVGKDRPFYRRSGGGVTLSGGEALCQPEFGSALLLALKENGYHTAMESMACADFNTIERYLKNLDLYLMDIKHMDPGKHKQYTGRSNELMLENAKKIAQSSTKLIIRVPVIPGFNDTVPEIRAIAQYAARLSGVEEMHLLPYHRLGQDKYTGLSRDYLMGDVPPPANEAMERLLEEVTRAGLKGQIGG